MCTWKVYIQNIKLTTSKGWCHHHTTGFPGSIISILIHYVTKNSLQGEVVFFTYKISFFFLNNRVEFSTKCIWENLCVQFVTSLGVYIEAMMSLLTQIYYQQLQYYLQWLQTYYIQNSNIYNYIYMLCFFVHSHYHKRRTGDVSQKCIIDSIRYR